MRDEYIYIYLVEKFSALLCREIDLLIKKPLNYLRS